MQNRLTKFTTEFQKRFSKNGIFRKDLNRLKALKKKYPQDETVNLLIRAYTQKIYGCRGFNFLLDKIFPIFCANFLVRDEVMEIEDMKFNLRNISNNVNISKIIRTELIDLWCCDEYFIKSKTFCAEPFMLVNEGPYQYHSVHLNPNDVVIDAGANMGLFSVFSNHYYNCKCYAFEPVLSTIELLKQNIALNRMENGIEIVPYALNDKECDMEIQIERDSCSANSFVRAPSVYAGKETVHCITLDQWANENKIQKIDFIKADIEGAERYLLAGATDVLKNFAPKLSICTYHLPDDPQVLENLILKANPNYKIEHAYLKLYAYVP